MPEDVDPKPAFTDEEAEALLHRAMSQQGRLSVKVAAVFIGILVLVPLVNLFLPDIAKVSVFGFTLSWLFLAVLFYVVTVALSAYFVKRSDAIETEISGEGR